MGHDIIEVSGHATMRDASTFSGVTGASGWRWLIGFSAPLFQFLAAIAARCSGFVPRSCIRRVAHIAKNAAGRIESSSQAGSVLGPEDWIIAVILSKPSAIATSLRPL